MLLTIYNLPGNVSYVWVKNFVRQHCGLEDIILDNLISDKPNTKRVTIGLAAESDAAILVRKMNGMSIDGRQLFVEKVQQKKASMQPYRAPPRYGQGYSGNMHFDNSMDVQQQHAPVSSMNPYQTPFNVNMQYCMPQVQNKMVHTLPQAGPSNQAPLYQNNIPFYLQPQSVQSQQETLADHQRNISIPNIQNNQRVQSYFKNNDSAQQKRNSHSFDNNQGQYNVNVDRNKAFDRGDMRGHNERRDEKKIRYDRGPIRDQSGSRDGRAFRDGETQQDRDGRREQNTENSRSSRFWDNREQNFDSFEPDLRLRLEEISRQQSQSRFDMYDNKIQNQFINRPSHSNEKTCAQQPRQTNLKPKTTKPNTQKIATAICQNQAGNLKRKFNALRAEKMSKKLVAQSKKRAKFEEMDINTKTQRFNTWVSQVSSSLAKEVMKSTRDSFNNTPMLFAELKKCIATRIFVIFDRRFPSAAQQIVSEYRAKYKKAKDYDFLLEVLSKLLEDKPKKQTYGSPSLSQPSPQSKLAPPTRPGPQIESAAQTSSTLQRRTNSMNTPLKTLETAPKNKLKINPAFNIPKTLQRKAAPPTGKLPTYPGADKQNYKDIKKDAMAQFLSAAEYAKKMLKGAQYAGFNEEIKALCNLYTNACNEVDSENGMSNKHIWGDMKDRFEKIITIQTINRMLNIPTYLVVRVYYSPKKPDREQLEKFLRTYNVISMKNSRKKMFVATCNSFEGYDKLCSLGGFELGGVRLTFKPLHLSGPSLKQCNKKQMGSNQNDFGSDNDNHDDKDGDDGDDYDDNDKDGDDYDDNDNEHNNDTEEYDNDTSVILVEDNNEVINLDDIEDQPENTESGVVEGNVNEGCDENINGNNDKVMIVENKDETSNDNEIPANNAGYIQPQEPEDRDPVQELNDKNDCQTHDIEISQIPKDTVSDLIVGDDSYVVLDDVDNEVKNNEINNDIQQDAIVNTDITEDDLEDF